MQTPRVHHSSSSTEPATTSFAQALDERGDAPPRSDADRPHTMRSEPRRWMTVALALLAFGLVAEPTPQATATPPVAAAPVAQPAADETQRVADLLAEWNRRLSSAERERIARAVMRWSDDYDLDPDLVLAVIYVESTARPEARSPKGAMGLMQVMPHMRAQIGLAGNATTIESNIEAGCAILSENIHRLGEDKGILAYFWGSKIRGDRYLRRVRHAQAKARRFLTQS